MYFVYLSVITDAVNQLLICYTFCRTFSVKEGTESIQFSSPYGGLIVIKANAGHYKFTMTNVAEAPRYDVSDPNSLSQWEER